MMKKIDLLKTLQSSR